MLPHFVTLDVLKLSGWLNADAPCRESKGGHTLRVEVRAGRGGRRRAIAGHAVSEGGAHVEHALHVLDAGRVEAQRLVERRRFLPRVERRAYCTVRGELRNAGGGGRPRCKQRVGEGSTADWGQGTRGAHGEHELHGRDAGRVEAQRLVEHRRALPRVERRAIRCGTRCSR
eukprot:scaffold58545_cov57-Phaeocystis_antarctica.AAC.2